MNNNIMQQTVRKQAKPRFRGEKTLKCRVALKYKQNTEREFIRIVNEVMVGMKKELDAEMKKIAKISRQDGKEVIHYDSTSDLMEAIEKAYGMMETTTAFLVESMREMGDDLNKISGYLPEIEKRNEGLLEEINDILTWG